MQHRLRGVTRAFLVALAVGCVPAVASAQEQSVRDLEKTFKRIAQEATPKTVCIKSYVEATGDKSGYGSGAIVSEDGYVLTCAHVVDIAKRCEVILPDGKTYPAHLLGKNKKQDYALVKIDATGLPFYEIGDSTKLSVGQWVMALGHPGGPYEDVQPAFAAGRITHLHRKLPVQMMDRFYDDGIQTDVPIFAGNSGGPLVDLDGKLVGLNGAIILINENAYAVPIHEVVRDLDAMKKGEMIAGVSPTQEDMAEFQKQMDPEMFNKLLERGTKNLFGKLFGKGENGENPLGKLFGGENGENPLGELFKNGDLQKMMKQFFGGGGEKNEDGNEEAGPDFAQIMKMLQKMFGGENGENPFGKMFGGENGEQPDLQKMMEGMRKMFGGGEDEGDEDESPAPAPRPRARPKAPRPAPAVDKGGYLGVKPDPEAKGSDGVVVGEVLEGSPAAKAGLAKGDVIVAVDGKVTPDLGALQAIVKSKAPGSTAVVTLDRARVVDAAVINERIDVKVTIAARDGAGK